MSILTRCICLLVLVTGPSVAYSDAARDRVLAAIDSYRGASLEEEPSADEYERLMGTISRAWDVYEEDKKVSQKVIRELLATESDSFLLLDLSLFLMSANPSDKTMVEVAGYVARANPHASDQAFFTLTSYMAAKNCTECLPAILKILELEELKAGIDAHALPVGITLGMVFTIYQFGDSMVPELNDRLDSELCAVRGNAAFALGDLSPAVISRRIVSMATDDPCEYARNGAMYSLTAQRYGRLPRIIEQWVERIDELSGHEKMSLMLSVSAEPVDSASWRVIEQLKTDPDPEVAETAKELEPMEFNAAPRPAPSAKRRTDMVRQLRRAIKKGRLDDSLDHEDYVAALTPDDIPLMNQARASLLARLSDECLYEWYPLSKAVAILRVQQRAVR